ncbi:hypothetical protein Pcinc_043779 [Petrolisthes cinctipes]|uniref:Uncharacterized protein n=1 Tax=Petrolisthes cinctipes TaxID=88211 RepID=A0AAE1BEV2_PETCI|nr:hypothetical protein Pcinc_043779 [Petrolisthes cinctipes]
MFSVHRPACLPHHPCLTPAPFPLHITPVLPASPCFTPAPLLLHITPFDYLPNVSLWTFYFALCHSLSYLSYLTTAFTLTCVLSVPTPTCTSTCLTLPHCWLTPSVCSTRPYHYLSNPSLPLPLPLQPVPTPTITSPTHPYPTFTSPTHPYPYHYLSLPHLASPCLAPAACFASPTEGRSQDFYKA